MPLGCSSGWGVVYCGLYRLLKGVSGKESAPADAKDALNPAWVGKMPQRSKWQPTSVFFLGKFYGQRSLAGCSPWGGRESVMTEQACKYPGSPKSQSPGWPFPPLLFFFFSIYFYSLEAHYNIVVVFIRGPKSLRMALWKTMVSPAQQSITRAPAYKSTEDRHSEVSSSPRFKCQLATRCHLDWHRLWY